MEHTDSEVQLKVITYRWKCPGCDFSNIETEAKTRVKCVYCERTFLALTPRIKIMEV